MYKFFILFLGLLLNMQVSYADDMPLNDGEQVSATQDNDNTSNQLNNTSGKIEYEVVHQIEREKVSLPTCDDEKLLQETRKYIENYLKTTLNSGTLQRRRNYFILHNLTNFKSENIVDYKTPEKSPVSDIIADVIVNQSLSEENIVLCKNQSKDRYAKNLYLLIYPKEEAYFVRVINLEVEKNNISKNYFIYQK